MIPVLTATQMREADRRTIEEIGLPGAVLMENAGAAVARTASERFPDVRRVLILCGKGNNGGDGFVTARRLRDRHPEILLIGGRNEVQGDARLHLGALERSGAAVIEVPDEEAWNAKRERLWEVDLVIDALLGTGLRRAPSGLIGTVIDDLVAVSRSRRLPVLSVDLPSGLSADSGEVPGSAVIAEVTVTFAAPKCGLVLPPACDHAGEIIVVDIGIPGEVLDDAARLWLLDATDAARAFGARSPQAHKGDFGHLLIIAGSVGKSGAAILAASAALRCGAGLVTVATPASALPIIAAGCAELMTEPLAERAPGVVSEEAIERALILAQDRDAVVLGPGLGQSSDSRAFVRSFTRRCTAPLIVDADGLNAMAPASGEPGALDTLRRNAPTIITPHPGEMARLIGSTAPEVQRRRLETARAVSVETGVVCVLKGHHTVVSDADGKAAINSTGNAGMATAGTGDVLAGVAGALLARRLPAWTAATAAVYLHGRAGDHAAEKLGEEGLTASDLISALPDVVRRLGS
ncbi:MAG: NAD(P)H-hydrate dehydratase [Vicinamibacteria bacterium]|nr:NAD(P)H-hydrate dehydratase [Vicinamibacteria bacterium]